MNPKNPAVRAGRRYALEFGVSMAAYVVAIFLSRLLWHSASGPWRTVVALAPVIPVVLLVAAMARYLGGTDELQRRKLVDSLALAGGATALIALAYGLVEGEGLPRPSAWWTFATLMVCWAVSAVFVQRRLQ